MKIRFFAAISIILSVFLLANPLTAAAATVRQVIVLDIPRFDLTEVSAVYPHWLALLSHSATGLVAPVSAAAADPGQIYLAFNRDGILKLPSDGYQVYNGRETIQNIRVTDLYRSLTGKKASSAQAVNINNNEILKLNEKLLPPGTEALGGILHKYGLKTAAIGNTDALEPGRSGAALGMDPDGLIDFGAVGSETLRGDPGVPYGIRSDTGRILKYCRLFKAKADFIIVTLGDLERIESFQPYLSGARKAYFRKLAMQRYDDFLGRLTRQTDFNATQLVVFSCLPPQRPQSDATGLAPVVIRGPGFNSGILASPTTRRPGIITYRDLRENLIRYLIAPFAVKAPSALRQSPGDWRQIATTKTGLDRNYFARWPLLTVYGVLLIVLLLLMVSGLCFNFNPRTLKLLCSGYLFLLTIPAVFLLEALFNPLEWSVIIGLTLGFAGLIFGLSYRLSRGDPLKILAWVSFFNVALVIIDGLWNGRSELNSFLGYSVISGARFYGIGNEYLGVLLGALIVTVSLNPELMRRWRREYFWTAVAVISLVLFHPCFGAKVGGGLAAILGLSITVCLWLQRPLRAKEIGKLIIIALFAFILSGSWDYANRTGMSHLGQLFAAIGKEGMGVFWALALRKLELNWDLIRYTPLTYVLIGILAAVPLLNKYPPAWLQKRIRQYPEAAAGLTGLCITALIALGLNDTGIVAAATMFMYGLAMVLVIVITERVASVSGANGGRT